MSEQMDERDELLEIARRVRERLAFHRRGQVEGLPRARVSSGPGSNGRSAAVAPGPQPPGQAELAPIRQPLRPAESAPGRLPLPAEVAAIRQSPNRPAATDPPPSAPPSGATQASRGADALRLVREDLGDCQRCGLGHTRTNLVFGAGNPEAPLVFVGEGPGETEDLQGLPFVGKAGELLTRMIAAMGYGRDQIYICNVVKCRPPGNRNPLPEEIAACEPFLIRQLGAIAPKVIVALGKFAAQTLLRSEKPISNLRGNWHRYQGIALMPTFHPAFVLRNPSSRREVWDDLKLVIAELDRLGIPHGPVGVRQ